MQWERELEVARQAARRAGEIALRHRRQGVTAEDKDDLSPVTIADRESEQAIVQTVLEAFPGDGLLGEEGASREGTSGRRWIIDPIDGTRDYVRGNPAWAVLIGLEAQGEVVAGVSYLPAMGDLFCAAAGAGAYKNDTRVQVSTITEASRAVLCLNGFNALHKRPFASRMLDWMSEFWAVRSMGGCLDAMMVTQGQAEVWIELSSKPWDLAPLKLLVEEAGGRFLNFDGGSSIYGGNCILSVPALAEQVLAFVAGRAAPAA
jgi:histidinol phosphatase-like enzyme (inositol monophosphatase family)